MRCPFFDQSLFVRDVETTTFAIILGREASMTSSTDTTLAPIRARFASRKRCCFNREGAATNRSRLECYGCRLDDEDRLQDCRTVRAIQYSIISHCTQLMSLFFISDRIARRRLSTLLRRVIYGKHMGTYSVRFCSHRMPLRLPTNQISRMRS